MKKTYFIIACCGVLLNACTGDISQSSDPSLALSTNSISFAVPNMIGATSSAQVELSNIGSADVLITQLSLLENDDSKEISLIDADDWTSETVRITVGESKILQLQWSPTNAVSDQATLTLVSNSGTFVIDITTPDLDPALRVTSDLNGELEATQGTINLSSTQTDVALTDRVQIKSIGLAPLTISKLCFIDSDDTCLAATGEVGRGQLSLCASVDGDACQGYQFNAEGLSLLSGEEHSFYLQYEPPNNAVDTVIGRILIESDSAEAPRYILRVVAEPCIDCEMAGEMAGEVAGEVAGGMAGEVAGEVAGEMAGEVAGEMAGEVAGEMMVDRAVYHDLQDPGVHMITLPNEVESYEVIMWGAGGSGGAQLGSTGGGGAALRFTINRSDSSENLIVWVGEGGGTVGSGGGGSFIYGVDGSENLNLLAVAAGGGGGGSDGNSGNSFIGGRGGAGGAAIGQAGQAITGHQSGRPSPYCYDATGGGGATLSEAGQGGTYLGAETIKGCNGISGAGYLGGSVTSRGSFEQFMCIENMIREAWGLAPARGNGGGGGGGGGYLGGGSGGFIYTYCGGGGGGGSSWVSSLAHSQTIEAGQANTPGFLMLGQGAGQGGVEDSSDLPMGDLSYQGRSGRVIIQW